MSSSHIFRNPTPFKNLSEGQDNNDHNGGHERCDNCGSNLWLTDPTRGDFICNDCGACVRGLEISPAQKRSRDDVFFVDLEMVAKDGTQTLRLESSGSKKLRRGSTRRRCSEPYKRQKYFEKLLSAWTLHQCNFREGDEELIFISAIEFARLHQVRLSFPAKEAVEQRRAKPTGGFVPSKEHIRIILIDSDTMREEDEDWQIVRGHFCRHYLPQWRALRYRMSGKAPASWTLEARKLERIREMFATAEAAFLALFHRQRKKWISYDFFFCRCLEILGRPDVKEDFPCGKTKKSRHENDKCWKKICAYAGWPYMNYDK